MNEEGDVQAPKECKECPRWVEIREKFRLSKLLEKMLNAIEKKIEQEDLKPTIGDYLKLMQMEQEVEQETAKEIKITWVDPTLTSNNEG